MSNFVIDVDIALKIAGETIRPDPLHSLLAPTLLRSQLLDVLFQRVRDGSIEENDALELHKRLASLNVRFLGDAVLRRRAWDIAKKSSASSTYAAEYIALTQLQGDALVTDDPALARQADTFVAVQPASALC